MFWYGHRNEDSMTKKYTTRIEVAFFHTGKQVTEKTSKSSNSKIKQNVWYILLLVFQTLYFAQTTIVWNLFDPLGY